MGMIFTRVYPSRKANVFVCEVWERSQWPNIPRVVESRLARFEAKGCRVEETIRNWFKQNRPEVFKELDQT